MIKKSLSLTDSASKYFNGNNFPKESRNETNNNNSFRIKLILTNIRRTKTEYFVPLVPDINYNHSILW